MVSYNHPILEISSLVNSGQLSVGEAIDFAFTGNLWDRCSTEQKEEIFNYFLGFYKNMKNFKVLAPDQEFLFIYSGLKLENIFYHAYSQINPQISREILKIVLDAYSDDKSQIMANAFRLYVEGLTKQFLEGTEGKELVQALGYIERATKVVPVNAQSELKQLIYLYAGAVRSALLCWMRRASQERLSELRIKDSPRQLAADSIYYLRRSLSLCSPNKHLQAWASTVALLADCLLLDSPVLEKHLEEALGLYESILNLPPDNFPDIDWGLVYHDLGLIYQELTYGNRSENINKSIFYYEKALTYRSRDSNPYAWATTQSNLGNSYSERPDSDLEQNMHMAIECYKNALEIRKRDKYPYDWAFTTNLLGTAYSELGFERGNLKNLENAEMCFKGALDILDEYVHPAEWASTMANLGMTYLGMYKISGEENFLSNALNCLNAALPISEDMNLIIYVGSLCNLLNVYLEKNDIDFENSIEHIISQLEDSIDRGKFPFPIYGLYKSQIGKYWMRKLQKEKSFSRKNMISLERIYKEACNNLKEALEIYSQLKDYNKLLSVCWDLANTHESMQMVEESVSIYEFAINIIERMRLYKVVEDSKGHVMLKHVGFYLTLFQIYIDQQSPLKALEVADRLKSRATLSSIYDHQIMPSNVQARKYSEDYWRLVSMQRELLSDLSKLFEPRRSNISINKLCPKIPFMSSKSRDINAKLDEIETNLSDCLKKIEETDPTYFKEIYGYKFPNLRSFFDVHNNVGIVTFQHSKRGVYIFYIFPHNFKNKIEIKYDLFRFKDIEPLNNDIDTWFEHYNQLSTKLKLGDIRTMYESSKRYKKIMRLMDVMLTSYGKCIGPGLIKYFYNQGINHLIFIPNRDNHLIPFSALRIPNQLVGSSDGTTHLLRLFDKITNLPNLSIMDRIKNRQDRKPLQLITATYSPPESPIPHCEWEVRSIRTFFKDCTHEWDGSSDEISDFIKFANRSNVLHISAHGMAFIADYHKSRIRLGKKIKLTYSDILDKLDLSHNYLVTLSACETGYSPNRMKRIAWDEYVGLDSAFMQVGARAVVSSLWLADDRATALLMYLFYKNLKTRNMDSTIALCEAQRAILSGSWRTDGTIEEFNSFFINQYNYPGVTEIKAEEDFSHPIYWANFKHLGLI